MKRALTLFIVVASAYVSVAQSGWQDTTLHRHSIGVDVSGFLFRYIGHSDSAVSTFPSSPYWASYRYRLNRHWNLRAAVGGSLDRMDRPSRTASRETYRTEQSTFSARVGIERVQELAKRWQLFYGLDLRASTTRRLSEETYSNAGYVQGSELGSTNWGPAALFGVRFRITPRFNLLTEAGLAFLVTTTKQREFYTPIMEDQPFLPDMEAKTTGLRTQFDPPLSITATFAF